MKTQIYVYLTFLMVFLTLFLLGCSSQTPKDQGRDGIIADNNTPTMGNNTRRMPGQEMNDTQRLEMMQKSVEACAGLSDGDACIFTTTRGEMEGSCGIRDSELSCMPKMQDRPPR